YRVNTRPISKSLIKGGSLAFLFYLKFLKKTM
ncbi:MAG: hypothetical protein ACI9S8_002586, partial [Chlamydiales bacterium]